MANMSYCRFQNTALDLRDCVNNLRSLDPKDISFNTTDERNARERIIEMAADLMDAVGIEIDRHELEGAIFELNLEIDEEDDQ